MQDPKAILNEVKELIMLSSPLRVSNSLRRILMEYLITSDDYFTDIGEVVTDCNIVFDLLDILTKIKD